MSTWSRAADGRVRAARRAGFGLLEAIVALAVAGVTLAVFARAFAGAWGATKVPMDVVSATLLAQSAALGAPPASFEAARKRGFSVERENGTVEIERRPASVAPAPAGTGQGAAAPDPKATPSAMQLAEPEQLAKSVDRKANVTLRRVSVMVGTPLGRRVRFETIRLDDASH